MLYEVKMVADGNIEYFMYDDKTTYDQMMINLICGIPGELIKASTRAFKEHNCIVYKIGKDIEIDTNIGKKEIKADSYLILNTYKNGSNKVFDKIGNDEWKFFLNLK